MQQAGSDRQLFHDWNVTRRIQMLAQVGLDDETLRDSLQSPSVRHPAIEGQLELVHRMEALGIDGVDIGYPASSPRALEDVVTIAHEIANAHIHIRPNCAGRTATADILPIAEAQQRSGIAIDAALFLGSSPIRRFAEGWDMDFLVRTTAEAVTPACHHGLGVMYVTEDTTRSRPQDLRRLYRTAIECGARRCVLPTL
jgi:2-isopropylmalate synthase